MGIYLLLEVDLVLGIDNVVLDMVFDTGIVDVDVVDVDVVEGIYWNIGVLEDIEDYDADPNTDTQYDETLVNSSVHSSPSYQVYSQEYTSEVYAPKVTMKVYSPSPLPSYYNASASDPALHHVITYYSPPLLSSVGRIDFGIWVVCCYLDLCLGPYLPFLWIHYLCYLSYSLLVG